MASNSTQTTDGFVVDDMEMPKWQMSPLTRRRWANFKAKKRGYWSLWIVAVMMVISFFAEFIANDKPLILKYEGEYFFPVLVSYPETEFGGIFETEAVYRSQAVKDLIKEGGGWMVMPLIPFSYCLLYTSPSPRDATLSRMPSSA